MPPPPISKQRRYQLRHEALGLCILCSRKAVSARHCRRHVRLATKLKRQQRGNSPWRPGGPGYSPRY
jgi:hypothetical protein